MCAEGVLKYLLRLPAPCARDSWRFLTQSPVNRCFRRFEVIRWVRVKSLFKILCRWQKLAYFLSVFTFLKAHSWSYVTEKRWKMTRNKPFLTRRENPEQALILPKNKPLYYNYTIVFFSVLQDWLKCKLPVIQWDMVRGLFPCCWPDLCIWGQCRIRLLNPALARLQLKTSPDNANESEFRFWTGIDPVMFTSGKNQFPGHQQNPDFGELVPWKRGTCLHFG